MEQGDRNLNKSPCSCIQRRDSSAFVKKIITLLKHQVTQNDIPRQRDMIREYMQLCKNGFFVKDLFSVMYLIELLLDRIYEVNDYVILLEGMLDICKIPPLLTVPSEVLTYARDLHEYFSMLGYLLVCLKIEKLQNEVAHTLISLLTKDFPNFRFILSLNVRKKCAENSRLPEILGQMLEIGEENIYPKILEIIILMATESDMTCKALIDQDALNSLLTRLESTWKDRYPDRKPPLQPSDNILHYEEVSRIIWILLKYLNQNRDYLKCVKSVTIFSLWNLQYTFRLFAENKNRYLDRNNMLSILIKLIDFFPNMDFIKSGLAKDLVSESYSPLQMKGSETKKFQQNMTDDDFTYLQLIISCIPFYVNFIGGVSILESHRTIYKLLAISKNKEVAYWPLAQECMITTMVLDVLVQIVPYMEDEFIENAGPNKILYIISRYQTSGLDQNILRKCLKTLNIIIERSSSDSIVNSLLYNDGLNLIIGLIRSIISDSDSVRQRCLGLAFCLLSALYKQSIEKSNAVIDITIEYMKQILHPESKQAAHDNRVIICVMDFVWEHIARSEKRSAEFVKKNGVFHMLDIIYKFSFPVQLVTLGALVDICEFGQCLPYIITWRRQGQKILPLLMKLFREENKRLNVKSGPRGEIADVKYPLMGKEQWIQTFCRCIDVNGSPAMADLFISCRPKIYALLQMLNERYKEVVDLADEHYKCYGGELQAEDQVTMLLAENFLALKLGEAWLELKTDLDRIPVTLIPADSKMMTYLIDRAVKWSSYLQKFQKGILQHAYEKELLEEQKLYNFLEESRLADALQALSELRYLARCSERMFRWSQKFLQNTQIEESLTSHAEGALPHRTYFSEIQVTPVFNQIVNVESKINKSTEEILISPVSPIVSDEEFDTYLSEDLLEHSSELNCDPRE